MSFEDVDANFDATPPTSSPGRVRHRVRAKPNADALTPGVSADTAPPATPAATVSDEDAVGYKKPPKRHQWKPGQSGNPRGRTRGSRNIKSILEDRLNDRVKTVQNGRQSTETALEAIIRGQVFETLTKRDVRRAIFVLGLVEKYGVFDDKEAGPGNVGAAVPDGISDDDAGIVRRLLSRLAADEDDA